MNQDFEPQNYHLQTNAILTFFGHSAQERDRKDPDNKITLEIVLGTALLGFLQRIPGSRSLGSSFASTAVPWGPEPGLYLYSFAGIPPKPSVFSGSKSTDSTSLLFKIFREATGETVERVKHLPGKL